MQTLKVFALMTGLTLLLVGTGSYFGGANGAVIMFVFAAAMNLGSYWFSDRIVLRMYRAQIVDRVKEPDLYGMVERLAGR
ncbi:MAG TPA: protease HtpX, partial [Gemmatimonadetes bacterium]|nr:protease HtpX [Gemmatimonadota bacterium]